MTDSPAIQYLRQVVRERIDLMGLARFARAIDVPKGRIRSFNDGRASRSDTIERLAEALGLEIYIGPPRFASQSEKPPHGVNETEQPNRAETRPEPAHPRLSGKNAQRQEPVDPLVTRPAGREIGQANQPPLKLQNLWRHFGHGAHSLGLSAVAATILLAAHHIHPGHMNSWQVYGGIPLYFSATVFCYAADRHHHRKRRANIPVDLSGGGRLALIVAALLFSAPAAPESHHGLAVWLAYAALILGAMSDGGWIAITATRDHVGFWRACYRLIRHEREAQRQYWAALFGPDKP